LETAPAKMLLERLAFVFSLHGLVRGSLHHVLKNAAEFLHFLF
jgi:hypothetical protein